LNVHKIQACCLSIFKTAIFAIRNWNFLISIF
jgi:hypothetical protein